MLHIDCTAPFGNRGALGAGVAILSRFPILETSSFSYTHNGSPIDVAKGDWIVGKGLFSVLLEHPVLYEVEVFNTHVRYLSPFTLDHRYIVCGFRVFPI
jgi:hypothetical protein